MKRTIKFVINGERVKIDVGRKAIQGDTTIDLTPTTPDMVELSICGDLGASGGQIRKDLRELGKDIPDIVRLCDIWDRWHLNGMKAGSRKQEEELRRIEGFAYFEEVKKNVGGSHYEAAKATLKALGLDPDNGYHYGSKWLVEPVPEEVLDEVENILDRLSGARLGITPDISDAPDLDGNYIDSRDVIKRLEIYRDAVSALGLDPDTVTVENAEIDEDDEEAAEIIEEFVALRDLESECNYGDWRYGATLIADHAFEGYARELADDLYGKEISQAHWPFDQIDWGLAAEALQADYTSVEFKGETYWVRA